MLCIGALKPRLEGRFYNYVSIVISAFNFNNMLHENRSEDLVKLPIWFNFQGNEN